MRPGSGLLARNSVIYILIQEAKVSKFKIILAAIAAVALATPVFAATFEFHGDLNNRFGLYTNQAGLYHGVESVAKKNLNEDDVEEFFADFKYRLNTTAATNDGAVKGVFAIEVGGVQFGTSPAGDFSGDGVVVEVRKAYTDFQLPSVQSKARVSLGLQALTVNKFVWWETVPSVQLAGDTGSFAYKLAWARGVESFNDDSDDDLFEDLDSLLARVDLKPAEGVKLGLFALYQRQQNADNEFTVDPAGAATQFSEDGDFYEVKQVGPSDFDLYTLGVDGGFATPTSYGNAFVNWDLIYQGGSVDKIGVYDLATDTFSTVDPDVDVSAYLLHADVGVNIGSTRLTYTGWYASGDDDPNDDNIDNFMSTDVDRFDSVIFFEGGYTDDDYFTEAPYILNKGLILNKLALDQKVSEKTNVGAAVLYLMTAEDLEYTNADDSQSFSEDTLGTEIDAYVSHKLYDNVEVALNAGYLFADDGMDFFENDASRDGSSDADVFRTTARVRYKF